MLPPSDPTPPTQNAAPQSPAPVNPPQVAIGQFKAIDLRTAKVVDVQEHPNADRLWIVTVDVGDLGKKTIVAGIRKDCPREELIGKTIVVVANLAPALLRGVESQGMLLAVKTPNGARPLTVMGEAGPGLQVT